ncbi:MAG: NAD-binding protein [Candidatus Latescibacteria bacterium]|nr:NAD-binding protein [Candidatus Latescibacterota bacterium]
MLKSFAPQLAFLLGKRTNRQNLRTLFKLLLAFSVIVTIFSVLFHLIMLREGQEFSWFTGFYWTLTVMSTLGFGDITFQGDLGRVFSMLVLLTGMVFLLIVLPFTFIQFFYAPWIQAQSEARAPRQLPRSTREHVLLTNYDPITQALINKLDRYHYSYYLITPDLAHAQQLYDQGINVVVGDLDNPETYKKMQIEQAALVAATDTDPINTHTAFTVRDLNPNVPIIARVDDPNSVDILQLAGCDHVLQLEKMLGASLARRAQSGEAAAHVIGQYEDLFIAETTATHTPLVGRTLEEIGLRRELGLTAVGVWERGIFQAALPDTRIGPHTVLVMTGTQSQLDRFNELFCIYKVSNVPVVIIGGGGVGMEAARTLVEQGLDYRIVERDADQAQKLDNCIVGDAADYDVLKKAEIMNALTVIITTHDDDINVYLTVYCRRLNPEIQIISRVTQERNIATLHRAGADFVMSYASMGADAIFNFLKRSDTLMVAESLSVFSEDISVFRMKMPSALVGKTIANSAIRRNTGCTVIALNDNHEMQLNPDPNEPLPRAAEILLIGSSKGEKRFLDMYVHV